MKKKLNITDSGPGDVIRSMAQSLGKECEVRKKEYSLVLPSEFGIGEVIGYEFDDGFGVIDTNYSLKKDLHFDLEKGIIHPLKIIFNTGDDYMHKLEYDKDYNVLSASETMVVASTPKNNHRFLIRAKTKSRLFSLEINRKLFENRISDFLDSLDPELEELFRDSNGVIPFSYKGNVSYKIVTMIEEFRECRLQGFSRSLYLEAKAYEIFTSFLDLYIDDIRRIDDQRIFRQNHLKAIKKASAHIKANLDNPVTINTLAKFCGVNTSILQNGFRAIYGMTVNEFTQNERLLVAKDLVLEGELTLSEIAYSIGLNSKSYFSKIFPERYGMTPSNFKEKYRRSSS